MSGSFAVSLSFRRAPLAFGLCLLAFLFAVEAKTAWYGPVVGIGGSVRAAKALPAAMPEVVEYGAPTPDRAHPKFAALPPVAAAWLMRAHLQAAGDVFPSRLPHFPIACFSPSSFFRPPPVFWR